jgi:hypothetical protein
MIYLNLTLENPWSDRFEHLYVWARTLPFHKAWELEIYRSNTIAEVELKFRMRENHAGLTLGLGLFTWTMRFQIHDTRHWNYEKGSWEEYDN